MEVSEIVSNVFVANVKILNIPEQFLVNRNRSRAFCNYV